MASISEEQNHYCTIINVFSVAPEQQQKLLDVLIEATDQIIQHMPGFVSANFHKSIDGLRVTNYAQWTSKEALEAMLRHPEARPHLDACRELASNIDFHIYNVERCFEAAR